MSLSAEKGVGGTKEEASIRKHSHDIYRRTAPAEPEKGNQNVSPWYMDMHILRFTAPNSLMELSPKLKPISDTL